MAAQIASVAYGAKTNKVKAITITWTSATGGAVVQSFNMDGALVRMVTNPGASAPTADYDITLVDADGVDLLAGEGADRHTTASEQLFPANTPYHVGAVDFTIAAAGDEKTGTCILYVVWG